MTNGEFYPSFILNPSLNDIPDKKKLEELLRRLNYCQMAFKIRFRSNYWTKINGQHKIIDKKNDVKLFVNGFLNFFKILHDIFLT